MNKWVHKIRRGDNDDDNGVNGSGNMEWNGATNVRYCSKRTKGKACFSLIHGFMLKYQNAIEAQKF